MFWGRRKAYKVSPAKLRLFQETWASVEPSEALQAVFLQFTDVVLDIGCGRGEGSLHLMQQSPETHVIVCDLFINGLLSFAHNAAERALTNMTIIQEDAVTLLTLMPDESLQKVFSFFPDPWPKKRHHKRRLLLQKGVLKHIFRCLAPKGSFVMRSDFLDYVEQVSASAQSEGFVVRMVEEPDFITRYHHKAIAEGRLVYACEFLKPSIDV